MQKRGGWPTFSAYILGAHANPANIQQLLTQPPAGADKDKATLEKGFPTTAEELFTYSGLILGSNEANYFTPAQQELIKEFANLRGGQR